MNNSNDEIPIKDEYIPKHANSYVVGNYKKVNNENISTPADGDSNNVSKTTVTIKKKKRRIKKWVWNVLFLFFLIMTIVSVLEILDWNKDNNDTSDIVEEINSVVEVTEKEDDENTEFVGIPLEEDTEESDYWYYVKFPLIDVDITKLKEKNSDTVGWINVNNTNINYPYVQYKDNSYYLDHSFDKSYNEAGWVFMDYRNNSDLSNRNTIIYAHSRLDKTMFGSLSKVLKAEWHANKDNHIIRISTENQSTLWQIFSVYKIEEESYYITTQFDSDEEYMQFLNTLSSRSIYNFNTGLTSEDKILTLSTCYSDTVRTVVHAKLIKKSINN